MTILELEQLADSGMDWSYVYVERLDENLYSLDDSVSWEGVTGSSNAYVVCNQIGDIHWMQEYELSLVTNGNFKIEFTDPMVILTAGIFIGI